MLDTSLSADTVLESDVRSPTAELLDIPTMPKIKVEPGAVVAVNALDTETLLEGDVG